MKKNNCTFFLILVSLLILIGLIFIYSSSSVFALEKYGSADYFVKKQFSGLILGLIACYLCSRMPLRILSKYAFVFFLVTFCITALTLIPPFSVSIHGSQRWLHIGRLVFQPSELLKIGFIVYYAAFFSRKEHSVHSFIRGYAPPLIVLIISAGLLLAQPDFGQMITLSATGCAMLFMASIKPLYLIVTLVAGSLASILLIYIKPYRFKRVMTFLNPWHDPQGAGFQIIQSLIAIGSGRLTGVGIAQSKQKFFYLPMQHTDFIFSIIAEEMGFLGSLGIIILYVLLLYQGLRIALSMKSNFCFFLVFGCIMLITLQATVNMAVVGGLLPTKGLGLPFMSYGKSALVAHLCMVGLIINCVRNNNFVA